MRRAAAVFSALSLGLICLGVGLLLVLRPPVPLAPQGPLVGPVTRIVVEKAARRMSVYAGGRLARVYAVRLGFAPVGDKRVAGDGRTPEGLFRIDRRNANSAYHLSLGLDYPRPEDRARAAREGVNPGGDIFLHGQPNLLPDSVTLRHDWTAGCVALSDAEIEELFAATPLGTVVEIRP